MAENIVFFLSLKGCFGPFLRADVTKGAVTNGHIPSFGSSEDVYMK